jgi:hypothetical protein
MIRDGRVCEKLVLGEEECLSKELVGVAMAPVRTLDEGNEFDRKEVIGNFS